MRRLLFIAVLLVPLVAVPPAQGKGFRSVSACGVHECRTSKDAGLLRAMTDVGPPTAAPARPAAYYRLNIALADGETRAGQTRLSWVPSAGKLLMPDGMWFAAGAELRAELDQLTAHLEPRPAKQLEGFPAETGSASRAVTAHSSVAHLSTWVLLIAGAVLLVGGVVTRRHWRRGGASSVRTAPDVDAPTSP